MVYNDELDQVIPVGWEGTTYGKAINFKTGKLNSNAAVSGGKYPFFTCSQETFKTNTFSFDCEAVLLAGNNASAIYPLKFYAGKFDAYQRTYVVTTKDERLVNEHIFFSIKNKLEGFKGTSSGTATKFLTMKLLNDLQIILAHKKDALVFKSVIASFFSHQLNIVKENERLEDASAIILAKMTKAGPVG